MKRTLTDWLILAACIAWFAFMFYTDWVSPLSFMRMILGLRIESTIYHWWDIT
jgi:hypothetical protein